MRKNANDPKTPEEWQEAADLAHVYLLIDSARKYGLVMGGPKSIDVGRCEELLKKAKRRGIRPRLDAIDRFVAAMPREEKRG